MTVAGQKLTAYELQVLIGTTISGCNMSPDRTFDLPAAWKRLHSLGLIDRADGIAHATDAGVKLVASILTELQRRREAEAGAREALIKRMVDRFLGWKLPEDFSPDGGISFEKAGNAGTTHEYTREPMGTNLLDAVQATAMVRYMLNGGDGPSLQPAIDRLIEIEKTTGVAPMAASPSSPASEEQREKEGTFVTAGGAKRVEGHYSNADTGVVGTVPTEVYLSYDAQAKEIAVRSVTETQTAIKNAILLFVLKARMAENELCAALIEDRGKNNVGQVHPIDAGHAAAIRSRLSALGEHP